MGANCQCCKANYIDDNSNFAYNDKKNKPALSLSQEDEMTFD
jgi:hypothetical protein